MDYENEKVKTTDDLGLKDDTTMQTLIDLNIKLMEEYREGLTTTVDLKSQMMAFRNTLLKKLLFTLAVTPPYAEEIMLAVDDATEELFKV